MRRHNILLLMVKVDDACILYVFAAHELSDGIHILAYTKLYYGENTGNILTSVEGPKKQVFCLRSKASFRSKISILYAVEQHALTS